MQKRMIWADGHLTPRSSRCWQFGQLRFRRSHRSRQPPQKRGRRGSPRRPARPPAADGRRSPTMAARAFIVSLGRAGVRGAVSARNAVVESRPDRPRRAAAAARAAVSGRSGTVAAAAGRRRRRRHGCGRRAAASASPCSEKPPNEARGGGGSAAVGLVLREALAVFRGASV